MTVTFVPGGPWVGLIEIVSCCAKAVLGRIAKGKDVIISSTHVTIVARRRQNEERNILFLLTVVLI